MTDAAHDDSLLLEGMANAIRMLSADAVEAANSGHPGMPMGMADVATVLFSRIMKYDAAAPDWPDRDRFVLSAGHGSMLLYSVLYLTGSPAMTLDQIRNFRQWGSLTPGHPEYGHTPGVETTTGPLGQGISTAVGMALAERMLNARFGGELVSHFTYVIAGDGCLMEGISQEAISLAGHLGLNRLVVLWDDNRITIDGDTELSTSEDTLARFEAAGWSVASVDGHDPDLVEAAIRNEQLTDKPSLIACRTVIGKGAPNKQGTHHVHGSPLGKDEIAALRQELGWTLPPFEVPAETLAAWRTAGSAGADARKAWDARVEAHHKRDAFWQALGDDVDAGIDAAMAARAQFLADKPKLATRQSSQKVLEALIPACPSLLGGSADLTGSNGTLVKRHVPVTRDHYAGDYLHYGVREHGMAACMNGLAAHTGFIPYGGTFLVFSDYMRPAMRLSALMGLGVIYVLTHDSIGLGEDGPTHQPVEHLAALRAIPNLLVLRPADAVETAESWAVALAERSRPSVLVLTRQGLPQLTTRQDDDNLVARGGYVVRDADGNRAVTLIATGSELMLACQAADLLAADGIAAAVVSMPCRDLFQEQDAAYRKAVLGTAPRVVVEAAVVDGWEGIVGDSGAFVGMTGFGASAPAERLFTEFGITVQAIANKAKGLI